MLISKYSIVLFLLFSISNIKAQNDTIWFNKDWKKTDKAKAHFFRPFPKKIDSLYEMKDYYLDGTLQMEAFSKYADKDYFQGKVIRYYEDGNIYNISHYKNNVLNGEFISFDDNRKKYSLTIKNGYPQDGVSLRNTSTYGKRKITFKNGSVTHEKWYYNTPKNQILQIFYYDSTRAEKSHKTPILKLFYNRKGKQIGTLTYEAYDPKEGTLIEYYYKTQNIRSKSYYKRKKLLYSDEYYSNGNPQSITTLEPNKQVTFYTIDGKVISTATYKYDAIYSGTFIQFHTTYRDKNPEGVIRSKITYTDGQKTKEEHYYTNGQLQSEKLYDAQKNTVTKEIAYNEDGSLIGTLTYKDYLPYEGIAFSNFRKEWYDKGKLIKRYEYFPKTKLFKSKREFNTVKFYNEHQEIIGDLEIDSTVSYLKPLNGKELRYNGLDVYSITEYKNGDKIKSTNFNKRYKSDKIFKTVTEYANGHYYKTKETKFYSNGEKQSEVTYKKGYNKLKGIFYNQKGEQIGVYDYTSKNGTEYKFFYDSDKVEKITTIENNILILEKEYKDFRDYNAETYITDYVLIKDLNTNSIGKFYNRKGVEVASIVFKDHKPYNGTVINSETNEFYTIKHGKKEGIYKKYQDYTSLEPLIYKEGNYKNDKRDGEFKTYDYAGQLTKVETYVNDIREGKTSHYKNGKEISSVIYKNDKPYEGKIVSVLSKETKTKTYKDGILIKELRESESGTTEIINRNEGSSISIFYPNSSVKKYSIQTDQSKSITGELIRYNAKGKEQFKALLERGRLISGEIWLKLQNSYDFPEVSNYRVKKSKDQFNIIMYNENGETILKAEENLFSTKSIMESKFYLSLDYININIDMLY